MNSSIVICWLPEIQGLSLLFWLSGLNEHSKSAPDLLNHGLVIHPIYTPDTTDNVVMLLYCIQFNDRLNSYGVVLGNSC